jgi:hypothetical protein
MGARRVLASHMRVRVAVLLAGPVRSLMEVRDIAAGLGLAVDLGRQDKEAAIVAASLCYQALLKPLMSAFA